MVDRCRTLEGWPTHWSDASMHFSYSLALKAVLVFRGVGRVVYGVRLKLFYHLNRMVSAWVRIPHAASSAVYLLPVNRSNMTFRRRP